MNTRAIGACILVAATAMSCKQDDKAAKVTSTPSTITDPSVKSAPIDVFGDGSYMLTDFTPDRLIEVSFLKTALTDAGVPEPVFISSSGYFLPPDAEEAIPEPTMLTGTYFTQAIDADLDIAWVSNRGRVYMLNLNSKNEVVASPLTESCFPFLLNSDSKILTIDAELNATVDSFEQKIELVNALEVDKIDAGGTMCVNGDSQIVAVIDNSVYGYLQISEINLTGLFSDLGMTYAYDGETEDDRAEANGEITAGATEGTDLNLTAGGASAFGKLFNTIKTKIADSKSGKVYSTAFKTIGAKVDDLKAGRAITKGERTLNRIQNRTESFQKKIDFWKKTRANGYLMETATKRIEALEKNLTISNTLITDTVKMLDKVSDAKRVTRAAYIARGEEFIAAAGKKGEAVLNTIKKGTNVVAAPFVTLRKSVTKSAALRAQKRSERLARSAQKAEDAFDANSAAQTFKKAFERKPKETKVPTRPTGAYESLIDL